jgi:hypothetical protein
MLTPRHVVFGARGGLLVGLWAAVMALAGPWHGLGAKIGVNGWLTHVIVFGALVALAYLAFPKRRRNDIAMALVLLAGAAEALQLFAGHTGVTLADWGADALGVATIHFAGQIENVRRLARHAPYTTFHEIRSADRRRGRRKSARAKAARTVRSLAEPAT